MSYETIDRSTRNQLGVSYDFSKIFLFDNKYRVITLSNATGSPVTLLMGTVIGTKKADATGGAFASGATDGTQYATGILAEDVTIGANSTADVQICVGGKIAVEKVILNGSDTMTTAVGDRVIFDKIGAETLGIELVAATEVTKFDNI